MKNQYFGDNKGLFIGDMVLQIMQSGLVERFTLIPMLTENDGGRDGMKYDRTKARAGAKNKELVDFLDDCIRKGKRNIEEFSSFLATKGIQMSIYYGPEKYFSHRHRDDYFRQIDNSLLEKSLVFIDPDNGLEVKHPDKRHIRYSEVKDLYERMSSGSILMLFQHFPRVPHMDYLNSRCEELEEKASGEHPICIDDGEAIFFFLTKDHALEHRLIEVVGEYAERYG